MIELRGEGLDFKQSTGWKREDKKAICKALLPALQMTRNLSDLASLEYDTSREIVIATFDSGCSKIAHVEMDSGTTMIKDILKDIL